MQIELIETFLDLCETRSFNKTAERLGVMQSTISGRVRTLERALDCRLLTRSRAGTELTTAGLRFEPHARNLRLAWAEARQAVVDTGNTAIAMRIGIQHDLLGDHIRDWVAALQSGVPQASLYVEADYSNQMCVDVMTGQLDIAILYTPKPHPDLHFETLGEVTYQMVSTAAAHLDEVRADNYILPTFSAAFSQTHAALLPFLSFGPVSSGQNAVIRELLIGFGGTTYVLQETAEELARLDLVKPVARAPKIQQPVFAAVHLRNRHRQAHRRMKRLLRSQVRGRAQLRTDARSRA